MTRLHMEQSAQMRIDFQRANQTCAQPLETAPNWKVKWAEAGYAYLNGNQLQLKSLISQLKSSPNNSNNHRMNSTRTTRTRHYVATTYRRTGLF